MKLEQLEESRRATESKLVIAQAVVTRSTRALADSLEKNRVLEEELGQLQSMVMSVVTKIIGPCPRSSMLVANLSEIPSEVLCLSPMESSMAPQGC